MTKKRIRLSFKVDSDVNKKLVLLANHVRFKKNTFVRKLTMSLIESVSMSSEIRFDIEVFFKEYYNDNFSDFNFRKNFKTEYSRYATESYSLGLSRYESDKIAEYSSYLNLSSNKFCRRIVERFLKACESESGHSKFEMDSMMDSVYGYDILNSERSTTQ